MRRRGWWHKPLFAAIVGLVSCTIWGLQLAYVLRMMPHLMNVGMPQLVGGLGIVMVDLVFVSMGYYALHNGVVCLAKGKEW